MEISEYDKRNIGKILYGEGTWFSAHLIRLIAKADPHNRQLLQLVYPDHVKAYLEYYQNGE